MIESVEDDAECIDTSYVGFRKMVPNDHPVSFADVVLLPFSLFAETWFSAFCIEFFPSDALRPGTPTLAKRADGLKKDSGYCEIHHAPSNVSQ